MTLTGNLTKEIKKPKAKIKDLEETKSTKKMLEKLKRGTLKKNTA
jgi:hypothetical protein